MGIKGRTLKEAKTKRNFLRKIVRVMSLIMGIVFLVWVGILGGAIYKQFFQKIYDLPPHYKDAVPSSWAGGVFRIEVRDKSRVVYGTGFSIGPQLVVTNAHVVGRSGIIVRLYTDAEKEVLAGRVVWIGKYKNDRLYDFAIINLGQKNKRAQKQVLEMTDKPMKVQDGILAMGFNQGRTNLSFLKGDITSLTRKDQLYQYDAMVNMGCSGGPLISTRYKKVVGIIVGEDDHTKGNRVSTGTKLAIPISEFLKRVPNTYTTHIGKVKK